ERGEGLGVEDGDGVGPAVGREPAAQVRGDGDAVDAGRVADLPFDLEGVGVEDVYLGVVGHIDAAAGGVHGQVVPAAVAGDRDRLDQVVRPGFRGQPGGGGQGEQCDRVAAHGVLGVGKGRPPDGTPP